MPKQIDTLHLWLSHLGLRVEQITLLLGDASSRHYYRIKARSPRLPHEQFIIMHAPNPEDKLEQFIKVSESLEHMGVQVPKIFHQDVPQGLLLLEDLGDELLLQRLNQDSVKNYYHKAMDIILNLQRHPIPSILPKFNQSYMLQEMSLFNDWFIRKHLNLDLSAAENEFLEQQFYKIANIIESHPQTMIHRDFHSRNLMVLPNEILSVIDFQDAMIGPRSYDLVSLLKDCYICWPPHQVLEFCQYFFVKLADKDSTFDKFRQEFTLCGLQRHLKVLGIFCRLFYRDGKSRYLPDLPLTWKYMYDALHALPELGQFKQFIDTRIYPKCQQVLNLC
jgi:aminoglycoside/choline kinase family phosphotransferase